ncbi:hypothetical protein FHT70_004748 [Rhizobium sp. BK049]|nr:hypothetical protein [Rhizobium sp. BK049]
MQYRLVEISETFFGLNQSHDHHDHAIIGTVDGRCGWLWEFRYDPF